MRYFFDNAAVIFIQGTTVFCDSDPSHPLVQLFLGLCAQVANVFGVLGLNLRMLNGETVFGRGFELGLPLDTIVDLKYGKTMFLGLGQV